MINVFQLAAGARVELVDGRRVVVEENMGDGQWVQAREAGAADSELVHAEDIRQLVQE
ncbi:hypothetical protein ABT324_02275 [Saccharopolyspora sp. NPDC000359]|uniref:hypothetical protein n=1 Tax=Saccharopolyspora sp. NPDC000359 TaxID=3154251 RepID=UPI003329D4F8